MNVQIKEGIFLTLLLLIAFFSKEFSFFQNVALASLPLMSTQDSSKEVGNFLLGFKFTLPEGWVSRITNQGVILGHNTIAGMILVLPHQATSILQMRNQMEEGIHDQGTNIVPSGNIQSSDNGHLIIDYSGYANGIAVKSKAIGVLFKNGGGAYILVTSTPEKYSNALLNAGIAIANKIHFIKQHTNNSEKGVELMNHFVGKWRTTTKNTTTDIYFYPDGVYSEHYEAAYSGHFEAGNPSTGYWGASNQNNGQGKWSVTGNHDTGNIEITYVTGRRFVLEYRVHIEKGRKFYNSYWFNGKFYWKEPL